ncbi:hypothetical protein [Halobacillus salinus]|uniref:DNA primase n=1 Tax=Halobacillus salinus TaxID=192814 RepID=A0A4Z0GZ32_9BACI|nr:hypothetical protein [Halobacillus salinus]TGB01944.1 hypothetical protein E4663_15030 [Halobacillus salinus]
MLKKWLLAIGLTSVLTLAACGGDDEGDMEDQESGEMEDSGSDDGEMDSSEDNESSEDSESEE